MPSGEPAIQHTATTALPVLTPAASVSPTTAAPQASLPTAASTSQVAFVAGDALWIVSLPDGVPVRRHARGVAGRPRWSPSGRWLSACVDDQLHVLAVDGATARALGPCGGQWIGPDDTLGYTSSHGTPRHLSLPDGSETVLSEPGDAWSRDGQTLLSVRQQQLGTVDSANAPQRVVSLWRTDAAGDHAVELFSPGTPSAYGLRVAGWVDDQVLLWPVASFSASLLADGAPLQVLPEAGGQPRTLVPSMLARDDFLAPGPGGRLAAVVGGDRQSWTNKRIALIDLASGRLQPLTAPDVAAVTPAWAPDGTRLVYVAAPDAGQLGGGEAARSALAQRRIWTVQADGTGARPLTGDTAYRDELPRWTADGQWIVFVRLDRHDQLSLWRIRPDGGELVRIAQNLGSTDTTGDRWFGYYGTVNWSQFFDVR